MATITADFFILLLSELNIRDFHLTLTPVQLCCSPCIAAAASHASQQSDTNTDTANYTTQHHIVGPGGIYCEYL